MASEPVVSGQVIQQFAWGWRYRFVLDFKDEERVTIEGIGFEKEPTQEEIDIAVAKRIAFRKNEIDNPPKEAEVATLTKEDVANLLIEKGYLTKGQILDDLLTGEEFKLG